MIKPTIGRIVWFRTEDPEPLAAIVCKVNDDETINLAVFGDTGAFSQAHNVVLVQDEDKRNPVAGECEWMPYQKTQAAKAGAPAFKVPVKK